MTYSPAVQALHDLAQSLSAEITAMPPRDELRSMSLREICITTAEQRMLIIVSDEYADADTACKAILLHLLLKTCEYYEDAANQCTWCQDMELPDNHFSTALYEELGMLVPKLRDIIGRHVCSISDYDIQFNTAIAKELRNLSDHT